MAFGLLNTSTPVIAVDFGAASLKALQIAPGDPRSLIAASQVPTPAELINDPLGRLEFQLGALPAVIKKGKFRGKRLMISVPSSQTWVQHLHVQRAEGVDLRQLVASQLQTQTGVDPASLVIRHCEVCETQRGSASKVETICVAVRRGLVLKILETLRAQKLEVVGVHSEHLALASALPALIGEVEEGEATVAIDLGWDSTKLVITHGEKPVFAKTIDVSGHAMDRIAADQLGVGLVAARERRLRTERLTPEPRAATAAATAGRTGIPALDAAATAAPETDAGGRAPHELDLTEPIEGLTDEIAMCLRYHKSLFPEVQSHRAVFMGGEARHEGLCRELASRLRLSAHVAEPLAALEGAGDASRAANLDLSKPQPGWALPLGLCLSPADI